MKLLPTVLLSLACAGLFAGTAARADEVAEVQRLQAAGQHEAALARAERFLAAKPADAPMRFLRGVALTELRRNDEAIDAFLRLTEDFPELPEPYNNLAALRAAAGDFDAAKLALDQALRAHPGFAVGHENLGDVLSMMALRSYSRALQLDPGNTSVPPKLELVRQLLEPAAR